MDDVEQIACATYTHARRHPMVLGQIGGWTPPFQLTVAQLVILVVCYVAEYQTWGWWAPLLPRPLALVAAVGGPAVVAFMARHTRVEGRSLPRMVVGWITFAWLPRSGQVDGRASRAERPAERAHIWLYLAPGAPR